MNLAMALFRKSPAQYVVSALTFAVPWPLKSVLTSRIGAPLTLLALAALGITGILQLRWFDGNPQLTVDAERASEVTDNVTQMANQAGADLQQAQQQIEDTIAAASAASAELSGVLQRPRISIPNTTTTPEHFELPPIANPHDGGFHGPIANAGDRFQLTR
jgi:hypothetical protein